MPKGRPLIGSGWTATGHSADPEARPRRIKKDWILWRSPQFRPPVARLWTMEVTRYQTSKKLQEGKKKSKTLQLKEVGLGPHGMSTS